ncbi:hypothetical protein PsYK624_168170 [Phanerochaete sordida]|uniref:Uncharacterized protein n=1 Tax=Phanerochaete sordida TaxID=48140 RepID=A0A9P3LNL0_9APHY|nr:hypothetical protein PsYK624_168170 [Phanerochaete sordida]
MGFYPSHLNYLLEMANATHWRGFQPVINVLDLSSVSPSTSLSPQPAPGQSGDVVLFGDASDATERAELKGKYVSCCKASRPLSALISEQEHRYPEFRGSPWVRAFAPYTCLYQNIP